MFVSLYRRRHVENVLPKKWKFRRGGGGGGGFHDYEILGDMGGNAFLNLRKQGGLKHGTRQ